MKTIMNTLRMQSEHQPDNFAIHGVAGQPCTYQKLYMQACYTLAALNSLGIRRNDPVAIVLPNGPLMAVVFLSVACGSASAPLNPSFTASEFEFYLTDLKAKAVVIEVGSKSPVIAVARNLGITIIALEPIINDSVGLYKISPINNSLHTSIHSEAKTSDIALILHTSGTTSRPKMVPLTQKNLCTSADYILRTLRLTPEDRCLNIMPLFHIHGLMAAVLASITAGSSIICTPGFFAPRFFSWIQHFQPTWYTAVPTMHQMILNRSKDNENAIKSSSLRFIRSSSASLAPNIMDKTEKTFGVPVIEAYGMTEASHQMASNPLPPGIRKSGSVGLPAGPEIAIMDDQRPIILPKEKVGEIVIRGESVTLGYLNNEEANRKSFNNGWFRTGDQGYLDKEGYLFITGRLKEIINRGGEKISPREIDEVLLEHPGISQAVSFSIPDEALGEDIAAAVILRDEQITEVEIKSFLAAFLAPHKIPKKIVILTEIPKGPTGKIQRVGLAEKLGLASDRTSSVKKEVKFIAPQNETEKQICEIWQNILHIPTVGTHNQFRDLGGDSMLATLIHQEMESVFRQQLALVDVFNAGTVSEQAKLINSNYKE